MIDAAAAARLARDAYVPEHLPGYVTAASGLKPHLRGDFVLYTGDDVLVFIGYPLSGDFDATAFDAALGAAIEEFDPQAVHVDAPVAPTVADVAGSAAPDAHYRLDLDGFVVPPKVRNMVRRAESELTLSVGARFGREHRRLVKDFLRTHRMPDGGETIYQSLPDYVPTDGARLYEVRDAKARLVAFDVAEFSAERYAFYLFNLRSRRRAVPGASDLLLDRLIRDAVEEGKRYVGLGLGIGEGIVFFKTKWGAAPYLDHVASWIERGRPATWRDLLR